MANVLQYFLSSHPATPTPTRTLTFETARTDVQNNQDAPQPPAKSQRDYRSLPKATGKTAPLNPVKSVSEDAAYAGCTPGSNPPAQSLDPFM